MALPKAEELTSECAASYINSQAVYVLGILLGMAADNEVCKHEQRPPRYIGEDFLHVINRNCVNHGDVLSFLERNKFGQGSKYGRANTIVVNPEGEKHGDKT